MSCSKSCDCCSGNCETQDTCHQDNVGVPRCSYAQCVDAGAGCGSSADCCGGTPCVPNPIDGGTPYVCHGTQCVQSCGACTNNADCCPGASCTNGVCAPCGGGSSGSSGGSSGGSGSGSGSSSGGSGGSSGGTVDAGCALYGQICTTAGDCCNGVPCTAGRCLFLQ
jgi:hypothetical protein